MYRASVPVQYNYTSNPLLAVRSVQSLRACTVQLYLYSPYGPYGLYRASGPYKCALYPLFLLYLQLLDCFFTMTRQPPVDQFSTLSRLHDHTHAHSHTLAHTTLSRTISGQVISSTLRPLSDNTHHSQQNAIHDPGGIRTRNPNS